MKHKYLLWGGIATVGLYLLYRMHTVPLTVGGHHAPPKGPGAPGGPLSGGGPIVVTIPNLGGMFGGGGSGYATQGYTGPQPFHLNPLGGGAGLAGAITASAGGLTSTKPATSPSVVNPTVNVGGLGVDAGPSRSLALNLRAVGTGIGVSGKLAVPNNPRPPSLKTGQGDSQPFGSGEINLFG